MLLVYYLGKNKEILISPSNTALKGALSYVKEYNTFRNRGNQPLPYNRGKHLRVQ